MTITADDILNHMMKLEKSCGFKQNVPVSLSIGRDLSSQKSIIILKWADQSFNHFDSIEKLCAFYETDVMPHFQTKETQ